MLQFSVIIPTFRRPDQLHRCLEALARQTMSRESFEVIVVDDGGQVPLEPLTGEFRERLSLTLAVQEVNMGPAAARNTGARIARGPLLVFTDDDCFPPPEWLERLSEACRARPGQLIGGRTVNLLPENPCSSLSQLVLDVVYTHYNSDPGRAAFFASNHMVVPNDRFFEIGGFSQDFRTAEDRDLCERWSKHGFEMAYAADAVTFHGHSLTLESLWRQHFHYGRGAFHFHRARSREGGVPFRPDWRFYRSLFLAPFIRYKGAVRIKMFLLLCFQQAANMAGYFHERFRRGGNSRT